MIVPPGAAGQASDFDGRVLRRYDFYVTAAAVLLTCLGVAVLVGWAWRIEALTSVLTGASSMRPNTAVCVAALGVSLWSVRVGTPRWRRAGGCAATGVVLVAVATLIEHVVGVDLGVDRILFGSDPSLAIQWPPGRMAPHTAVGLLLLGTAHLLPGASQRRVVLGQVLSLASGALGVLGLCAYTYQVPELASPLGAIAMAVHTAVALTVGSVATFVARPTKGLARALTTRARSAMLTRRILPATLLVPLVLGWLRLAGERHGVYGTELGVALLVAANVAVLLVVTIGSGGGAVRLEVAHQRAEAVLAWHSAAAAMAEAAPDAMVGVDARGAIVLVNAQAERLFGYPRGELVGRPVELVVPEAARPAHPAHRAAYLRRPHTRQLEPDSVLYVRRKDGTEVPVEISLSTLDTEGRRLIVAAVRDITDRVRYEHQLREKNDQLRRANLAKDTFLATMSHELRTPLNAVVGFTGTLLMGLPGPLNDKQAHQLRLVDTASQHLLSLINDVLDLAKIEAGQLTVRPEQVDCAAAAREVIDCMRPLGDHKGLTLVTELPDHACFATVDRRALRQILINLIDNAIKFTTAGEVRVSLARDQHEAPWTLTVSDTGPGIPPAEQARIFEAFHRTAEARALRHDGAGLGLYISQTLAQLMDCPIHVTSSPSQGSTFTLTLRGTAG